MTGSLDEARVATLRDSFSGTLLLPGDDGYDDARRLYNGLIEAQPGLIAGCRSVSDVAAAISFAREAGLEISVRGGGHGVAGRALTDGGVTIDLSAMRTVEVDPATRAARAQGGATWADLNDAAAEHGLATTGGVVSTTGIAGLTLGGGFGYLMPKHGMAADNLSSVELVTADGDVVTASADDHPDLFWALRGAGANLGVATSLEYRLHPLAQIVGGVVVHPFEAARDFLRFFAGFTADVSDDLYTFAGLGHAPDGSGMPVAVAAVGHAGDPTEAEIELKPLLDFGAPVMTQVGPMPYPAINTMFDEAYPTGSLNYWKSSFLRELDDDTIDAMIEAFDGCPSPMSGAVMEHFHGAATRVAVLETAVPHREPGYNYLLTSVWMDPAATDENVAWTRAHYRAMEPYFEDRRYVNYLSGDDATAAGRAVYGPNYDRLTEIKARYDPDNVFHLNQNIEPRVA
jgi:FAD/FMN-containing dehydrogenase